MCLDGLIDFLKKKGMLARRFHLGLSGEVKWVDFVSKCRLAISHVDF